MSNISPTRSTFFKLLAFWPLIVSGLLAGCVAEGIGLQLTATPSHRAVTLTVTATILPEESSKGSPALPSPGEVYYGYTYQRPDGNRLLEGSGDIPNLEPLDIPLEGVPAWVVAAPSGKAGVWVAALQDGRLQAFQVSGGNYAPIAIQPDSLPPGAPPLLQVSAGGPAVLVAPDPQASQLTHPAVLSTDPARLAYIDGNGDVVIWAGRETARLAVNALPDARLLVDENARILLLTEPTERYDHGVLGDALEAAAITMIETQPVVRVAGTIAIEAPAVIEGVAPIWADVTGDSEREIIVTLSDRQVGARLVVFNETGDILTAGPAIGQGYRWRNQLAVIPGPNGALEVVDVLTPHIGGVVEFFRFNQEQLELSAQAGGYTSHVIGTRNLDMGAAGDFDGDGRLEVLLPNQSRTGLGAIYLDNQEGVLAWSLALGGKLSTNLAGLIFPDGRLALGLGLEDGVLRVWSP